MTIKEGSRVKFIRRNKLVSGEVVESYPFSDRILVKLENELVKLPADLVTLCDDGKPVEEPIPDGCKKISQADVIESLAKVFPIEEIVNKIFDGRDTLITNLGNMIPKIAKTMAVEYDGKAGLYGGLIISRALVNLFDEND